MDDARRHRVERFVERLLDRRLADHVLVGEAHAVGRQHAAERVHEHPVDAERIGDAAGMLAAGAAEALEGVAGDVVTARDRNFLDRVGHRTDRDVDEPFGHRLGGAGGTDRRFDLIGKRREPRPHHLGIERLVGLRPEHPRKMRRLDLADHHIGIGHRQRPAAPVAGRPGVGPGALGAGAHAGTVEGQDRTTARRHGVDAHHRRAHPHAGHLGLERALEFTGEMAHVGRGAAHVETDDLDRLGRRGRANGRAADQVVPRQLGGAHHADDAAGRPGKDRILALERTGIGQATARLHEIEPHPRHLGRHLLHVAAQDRREVSIDHGGVAAPDQLHQRAYLVRHADLREADLACQPFGGEFVCRIAPAVHEDDRHARQPRVERRPEALAQMRLVERLDHLAVRPHAFHRFDHPAVEQLGQHDAPIEDARPLLVADAQRIAKPPGRDQQGRLALAFEQRVGRDRGAHLHALDQIGRDRFVGTEPQQVTDAGHRRVAILLGVLAQQLMGDERAIGPPADDIGEGAAAVDPELPAGRFRGGSCTHHEEAIFSRFAMFTSAAAAKESHPA